MRKTFLDHYHLTSHGLISYTCPFVLYLFSLCILFRINLIASSLLITSNQNVNANTQMHSHNNAQKGIGNIQ